jgi:hypothetical protein
MTDITHDRDEADEPVPDERAGLIGQIAALREEAKGEHWLDVEIPGYKGLLWARFRPFPVEKTEAKVKQLQKVRGPVLLDASCDVLIDACEQLLLLPAKYNGDKGEDGENLIPVDTDLPVRFDQRAAELFKVPNPTGSSRGVVKGMFPTEQSILAIQVRVSSWMQDVTSETDDQLVQD